MDLAKHWRMKSRTQIYFKSSTLNIVSRIGYRQKMQGRSYANKQAKDAVTLGQSNGEVRNEKPIQTNKTKTPHSMCPEV